MTDQNEAAALEEACRAYVEPAGYNPWNQLHPDAWPRIRSAMEKAIAAYKQALPAAPGDWVLVPREPTEEMIDAAFMLDGETDDEREPPRLQYKAMLAAALTGSVNAAADVNKANAGFVADLCDWLDGPRNAAANAIFMANAQFWRDKLVKLNGEEK